MTTYHLKPKNTQHDTPTLTNQSVPGKIHSHTLAAAMNFIANRTPSSRVFSNILPGTNYLFGRSYILQSYTLSRLTNFTIKHLLTASARS